MRKSLVEIAIELRRDGWGAGTVVRLSGAGYAMGAAGCRQLDFPETRKNVMVVGG